MKYIDAEKLKEEIERLKMAWKAIADNAANSNMRNFYDGGVEICKELLSKVDSLQQEQPMPDSTQLIAEWEKEKAVLEQKDFRGDVERMAYNAFLDGFVKGLGYESTR